MTLLLFFGFFGCDRDENRKAEYRNAPKMFYPKDSTRDSVQNVSVTCFPKASDGKMKAAGNRLVSLAFLRARYIYF